MRRRLTIAVLGAVAVSLLLAGIVSLTLVRRADRQATQQALEQEAATLARLMESSPFNERPSNPRLLQAARTLRRSDVSVLLLRDSTFVGTLPDNVLPQDLFPLASGAKRSTSGVRGSTAWAAAIGQRPGQVSTAIVLTDDADQFLGTVLKWMGVSAAVSLALGAIVAAVLGRRISEPISRARDATRMIADGDLSVRLSIDHRHRDEISDLSYSINDMAESLERSQNLERQFLMSISHDLRTPLTSIKGYSEAIADGTAEDQHQAAEVIVAESARLERLVSDLLDLARLDAREFTLDYCQADVGAVLQEVCAGFAQEAAERSVELQLEAPDDAQQEPVTAWCDPFRLAQVVANLVQNSLRFADSVVEVECRTVTENGRTRTAITVADDGLGISEVDRPHVFERLYVAQHSPQPKERGSGLGLCIVAELTKAMGGEVSVASRHPSGTRFALDFPAVEP